MKFYGMFKLLEGKNSNSSMKVISKSPSGRAASLRLVMQSGTESESQKQQPPTLGTHRWAWLRVDEPEKMLKRLGGIAHSRRNHKKLVVPDSLEFALPFM